MTQNDTALYPQPRDILVSLRLLTRLPLPQTTHGDAPGRPAAASAWCWPLIGVLVSGLAMLAALCALPAGAAIAAAVGLGAQAILTGAMHEDGLADTADGLWGGWEPARRLEIMKDSHIGTYGVMALLLVALIRWSALTTLLATGQYWVLLATGAISRAPMAVLMSAMPNARGAGLSSAVGHPPKWSAATAFTFGALAALLLGPQGISGAFGVAGVSLALTLLARAKIGGQTGDILGASQQLAEATFLATLAAFHFG